MRTALVTSGLLGALIASTAGANPGDGPRAGPVAEIPPPSTDPQPPPRYVPGETIIIHDRQVPKVVPHPRKNYHRMAPPYSDEAIDRDVWAKAWVLLDIDAHGVVQRVKLLNRPGYDLDHIAIAHAMKLRFDPAENAAGHAIPSQLVWSMEWPSYWWLVDLDEPPNRIPDRAAYVPCAGSGPMQLESLHPTYRNCSSPDFAKMNHEPWVTD